MPRKTTTMCVSLPFDMKELIEKTSAKLGVNQSKLIIRSVMFYIANDKDVQDKIALTVIQQAEPDRKDHKDRKPDHALCEIGNGRCKGKAVAKGEFGGKEYLMCSDHVGKLAGVKGWVIR